MAFVDVSAERRSSVWQNFLLNKTQNIAKCKICEKVLKTTNGNTKSLLDHLELVHGPPKSEKSGKSNIQHYFGRKNLGETITKLAIDGITFRCISQSKTLREAFTVSCFNLYKNYNHIISYIC